MRPSHNPKRVVPESVSEDSAFRERRKVLLDLCNDIREKAQLIPYSHVPDDISRKISDLLTHPTPLLDLRWQDVMAKLGYTDLSLLGRLECFKDWPKGAKAETPFFLFLTRTFAEDEGTLWKLIEALSVERYTDVMENVKTDVSEFVATYTSVADNQQNPKSLPLDTLDSGVGQSLSMNGSSSCHFRGGNINSISHVQSPTRNHDLLINPKRKHIVLDYLESLENRKQNPQENLFWPKQETLPNMSFLDEEEEEDDNLEFNFPFENKSSKAIKIFIPHTDLERDEEIAEEIAGTFEHEHQFKPYLLKNMTWSVNMDVGQFVMKVMESMDFLVPVISTEYLQEIVPTGNTSDMSNHRLVLRYIHAVSQTRVINKNSLNYLIRPLIVDGVSYGMVRRWHEFQSAVRYPKDLGRLAKKFESHQKNL